MLAIALGVTWRAPSPSPAPSNRIAQAAVTRPAFPKPAGITVPEGTRLVARTAETVSTNSHRTGDAFTARLHEPITVDGQVVAVKGTRLAGRVVESEKGGRLRGRARIALELNGFDRGDGSVIPISTNAVEQEAQGLRSRLILIQRSVPAVVRPGAVLHFQLQSPVNILEARRLPAGAGSASR
jgi:hypothetical protein